MRDSQSWFRGLQACDEAGAIWYSDSQTSRHHRLNLAWGKWDKGGTLDGPEGSPWLIGSLGLGLVAVVFRSAFFGRLDGGSVGEGLLHGSPQWILMKRSSPWF